MKGKSFSFIIIFFTIIVICGIGFHLFYVSRDSQNIPDFKPMRKKQKVPVGDESGTVVGTGYSVQSKSSALAAKEAVRMAMGIFNDRRADFAMVVATSGCDLQEVLSSTRELLGSDTLIHGQTSDSRGVMTDKGFVSTVDSDMSSDSENRHAVAVMTVASRDIRFGVGSAEFEDPSGVAENAAKAVKEAFLNAGRELAEKPDAILTAISFGYAEAALTGIESVVGKNVTVLGGTAGGPEFGVIGSNRVYEKGISLAVIFTDLLVGWVFEGGFDVTDVNNGVVTDVDGYAIVEIDGRPAMEVYDQWLGGKVSKLVSELADTRSIKDYLTLHPIYRRYTMASGRDYCLFSHPSIKDKALADKRIYTSTKIHVGDRIFLSHGTWETLLNRIGKLPHGAKIQGGIPLNQKPPLGIGFVCAGVMGTIPASEREKMSFLINYGTDNAPFISPFTWGEQGHLSGIGNRHGNLLTSFLVIGEKKQ